MHFIAIVLVFFVFGSAVSASEWGYPDLDTDQDAPFPKWGGICDHGRAQSPINLHTKGSLKGEFSALKMENYNRQHNDLKMFNNGHTIQLTGFQGDATIGQSFLVDDFTIEQVHFHWWSEHTINDIRYPLEVHLVHRNKKYPNMTMAANFKDGITVLGVLYHVSNTPNDAIDVIIKYLDGVKSYKHLNEPVNIAESVILEELLPSVDSYFTYAGSLTTPTCAEAVTWIVLTHTFPVTLEQVNHFKEIEFAEGRHLGNNYRELQNQNNRAVVLVEQRNSVGQLSTLGLGLTLLLSLASHKLQL